MEEIKEIKEIKLRKSTFTHYKLYTKAEEEELKLNEQVLYYIDKVYLEYMTKYNLIPTRDKWFFLGKKKMYPELVLKYYGRFIFDPKNYIGSMKYDRDGNPYTSYRDCDLEDEYVDRYDCICYDEPCNICIYKEEEESFQSLKYQDNKLYIIKCMLSKLGENIGYQYNNNQWKAIHESRSKDLQKIIIKYTSEKIADLTNLNLPQEIFDIISSYLS